MSNYLKAVFTLDPQWTQWARTQVANFHYPCPLLHSLWTKSVSRFSPLILPPLTRDSANPWHAHNFCPLPLWSYLQSCDNLFAGAPLPTSTPFTADSKNLVQTQDAHGSFISVFPDYSLPYCNLLEGFPLFPPHPQTPGNLTYLIWILSHWFFPEAHLGLFFSLPLLLSAMH